MGYYSHFTFYMPPGWEPVVLTPEQRQLAEEAKRLGLDLAHDETIGGELWSFDPEEEVFCFGGYEFWEHRRGFDEKLKARGWRCWTADERFKFYQHNKAFLEMSRHYRDQLIIEEALTEESGRFVNYYYNGTCESFHVTMTYPVPETLGVEGVDLVPWEPYR